MKETEKLSDCYKCYSYYDRKGNPMTFSEWGEKLLDMEYKIVSQTNIGDFFISTLWLGLNHAFGNSEPEIFETMIFKDSECALDGYQERYSTEKEALIGHETAVSLVRIHILIETENKIISSQEAETQKDSPQDKSLLP